MHQKYNFLVPSERGTMTHGMPADQSKLKFRATVVMTGVGTPLTSVG